MESQSSLALGDPVVKSIFAWFAQRSPRDAQHIGPAYVGVMYYDAAVWELVVPVVMGKGELDAGEALRTMPIAIRNQLLSEQDARENLAELFADCADYGMSFHQGLRNIQATEFAKGLLDSADRKLRASAALLLGGRPNQDAAESARYAVELFLKGLLAVVDQLDEQGAIKLSHHIDRALDRAIAATRSTELIALRPQLVVLPSVSRRYEAADDHLLDLWRCYFLAQQVGAIVSRLLFGTSLLSRTA